jgi:hypothetical protein
MQRPPEPVPAQSGNGHGAALQAAEKLKTPSFRGTFYAEESLILLALRPRDIPRFARNEIKKTFSAACSGLPKPSRSLPAL